MIHHVTIIWFTFFFKYNYSKINDFKCCSYDYMIILLLKNALYVFSSLGFLKISILYIKSFKELLEINRKVLLHYLTMVISI